MRKQLGTYDGNLVQVGDTVYVAATVRKVVRSEELLVAFRSKTTEYEELVSTDRCELDLPELGEEPPDGTMLECRAPDGTPNVFKRDDVGSADHGERRFARTWWSYVDQKWVDWPFVVSRGGLDGQILSKAGTSQAPAEDADPLAAIGISERDVQLIADVLEDGGAKGRTVTMIATILARRVSEEALHLLAGRSDFDGLTNQRIAGLVAQGPLVEHLRWRCARGDMERITKVGSLAERWAWTYRSA